MWKVVGHINARAPRHAKDETVVFGPHPAKRWVGPHVEKRRVKKAPAGPRPAPASVNMQAEEYARWLAARDGVVIPAAASRAVVILGDFKSSHRVTASGRPVVESRAIVVHFCIAGVGEPAVSIELPNWDFDPLPPVEELLPCETVDEELFAA